MDHREICLTIVHPNRLYRESLAFTLARQEDISVVAVVAELPQADTELTAPKPAVFVVDFGGAGRRALNDAQRIHSLSQECKILVINVPSNERDILACIECGASGYLLHDASVEDLIRNIRAISAGETLCPPRIASLAFVRLSQLSRQSRTMLEDHATMLTRRELEIIAAIEKGWSNKEIAVCLNLEVSTVKNHVHNILDKLRLKDRHQAAQRARDSGLIFRVHPVRESASPPTDRV